VSVIYFVATTPQDPQTPQRGKLMNVIPVPQNDDVPPPDNDKPVEDNAQSVPAMRLGKPEKYPDNHHPGKGPKHFGN
jgi:hypothetical protein